MVRAIWNDTVIAESDDTVVVEGNHYFPREAVNSELLEESKHRSFCFWKGVARYYSIEVDGELNRDAAWYYSKPRRAAAKIKGRIAFWRGVEVIRLVGPAKLARSHAKCEISSALLDDEVFEGHSPPQRG